MLLSGRLSATSVIFCKAPNWLIPSLRVLQNHRSGLTFLLFVYLDLMPREQERITYLSETTLECMSGRREARISDLSVGGCFIDSIAEVRVGEEITFELRLPGGTSIPVSGRVAYVLAGNGFGVSFTSLPEESREVIEQMVGGAGA